MVSATLPWLLLPILMGPGILGSVSHIRQVVFRTRQEMEPLFSQAAQVAKRLDWVRKVRWAYEWEGRGGREQFKGGYSSTELRFT